jgi:hypothetical protein
MVKDGNAALASCARTIVVRTIAGKTNAAAATMKATSDIGMIRVLEQGMKPPGGKQVGEEGGM